MEQQIKLKCRISLLLFFIPLFVYAQSEPIEWVQKAYFNGGIRCAAVSFTIGQTAYVGTGTNPSSQQCYQRTFYKYDSSLDIWYRIAELPTYAQVRNQAIGFSVAEKGYIVGGESDDLTGNNNLNDCWEYNPKTNLWYQRQDFPRFIKEGIGFGIGNKGYVGLGTSDNDEALNDFFEFDPSVNTWKKLNEFPGAPRKNAVGFSLNGKGYIGMGWMIQNNEYVYFRDFWEYDPQTDSWTRLTDFPGSGRYSAIGYGVGNSCYIGMGKPNDFYQYNLSTKEWKTLGYLPGLGRDASYSFAVNNKIFYGGGQAGTNRYSDLWEFDTTDLLTAIPPMQATA